MLSAMMLASLTASVPGCAGLLSDAMIARASPVPRSVSAGDLLRLRDFGQLGAGSGDERIFAIAPNGREVALHLRRADPVANRYCLAVLVIDLKTGRIRVVDRGGDLVRPSYSHSRKLAGFPMGVPAVIAPIWSPDGRSLAFLKRLGGLTQAWKVGAHGGRAEQITHEDQDVSALAWSADGRRLVIRTDRALTRARAAIKDEGRSGWHYDDRFQPTATPVPFPRPSDAAEQLFTVDLSSGITASAGPADRAALMAGLSASRTTALLRNRRLAYAETAFSDESAYQSARTIKVRRGAHQWSCREIACANAVSHWLAPDGQSVLLLSRSGWGGSDLTFYRWHPGSKRLSRLSTTSDLLLGCQPVEEQLLCALEEATRPRRLALVDPVTGRRRLVFNPNPDYDRLRTGAVERLRLRGLNGAETFADLMLPVGYVPKRQYPLVVVSYESRGFLRGGTGDEYPIPAFASTGISVLSFQRPRDIAMTADPGPVSDDDFARVNAKGWADRRNVNAALNDGVAQVVARRLVDTSRIGITGLSDGLATAAFAMLNSTYFSAAALSGCCEEPTNAMVLQGPEFARMMAAAGYPPFSRPDARFWAPYSIAQNAAHFATPLLIQAPDREFVLSLPTVHALREAGAPVDLYVYPGEFHIKWQPMHRLAVYERALRWFTFWFDLAPAMQELGTPVGELERWRSLREDLRSRRFDAVTPSSAPTPPHR